MFASLKLITLSLTFLASVLFGQQHKVPVFQSFEGLISLAAVKTLPKNTKAEPVRGYPGSKLHYGAFTSQKQWDAFAKHFKAKSVVAIDWKTQAIAYVVLDAQTNALSDIKMTRKNKVGVISFQWDGIEPFYVDATPAVLLVIDRSQITSLEFRHSKALGTFKL